MRYDYDMRPDWVKAATKLTSRMTTGDRLSFDQFQYDRLTVEEAEKLRNAVNMGTQFVSCIDQQPGQAMLIIAQEVEGDALRTGYGCGKTRLAETIADSNVFTQYYPDDDRAYTMRRGSFYEAREIMALFDSETFRAEQVFAEFGNLIVIDDVGREGILKFIRQADGKQESEVQARYYNVIDYCYQNGISMVLTSNLTARELADTIGGATWSRLLQMVPDHYRINLTGLPDMRPSLAMTWDGA